MTRSPLPPHISSWKELSLSLGNEEQMPSKVGEVMKLALSLWSLSANSSFNSYSCNYDVWALGLCHLSAKMDLILGLSKMVNGNASVQETKHFSLANADSNVEVSVLTLTRLILKEKTLLFVY